MKPKPSITRFPSLLALLILVSSPLPAAAAPREVTLFPGSARVTDILRITPQATAPGYQKAVVTLPAQLLPDTLQARLDPNSPLKLEDLSWRPVSRPDDARVAELRRQLAAARGERVGVLATIQSLEAQLQFWQAQAKAKARTAEETVGLAAQIGRSIRKDTQEKMNLEPELERLERKLRELQEEIGRITGQKESLWEITLSLSGPPVREIAVTLIYTLTGCGWSPLYRLEARPREGVIRFSWEAEIWQSSGSDWSQVETELATLQPRAPLAPPDLPPWIIRPRPEPRPLLGRQQAEPTEAATARLLQAADSVDGSPREERQSTYALWTLGRRTIPAGTRQRLKIRDEVWPAEFLHLLRPALTADAFVQATVRLPEGREIPLGTAVFLIDGALLGKRPFHLAGQEGRLSFGTDPLVSARSRLLSRKSGEKGLIVDRQTQEWAWRTEITNAGAGPVRVRVEEPLPQPRDGRIRITTETEPEAGEKGVSEMVWQFEIPGGQKRTVSTTIRLDAPREMELDLGWRR